ncbi:MAG: biotin/lipoyl-containing protein, partial [Pseudomonadota bacterium]
VTQGLTCEDVLNPDIEVSFPDSVVTLMKGYVGQAHEGFPEDIVQTVLKGEKPITERPGALLEAENLEARRSELQETLGVSVDDEDLMGAMMYPKVFADYTNRHKDYGPVRTLPTRTFFYGMETGEEITAEIDPGKTLEIRMVSVGETHEDGEARVFFELNGQPRTIRIPDRRVKAQVEAKAKADPDNMAHLGAPMPGVVTTIGVSEGQKVSVGDLLLTIEAMKMETGLHADRDAVVKRLHIQPGGQIDAKDLLIEFE